MRSKLHVNSIALNVAFIVATLLTSLQDKLMTPDQLNISKLLQAASVTTYNITQVSRDFNNML